MAQANAVQPNDKREIFGWAMYDWANSAFSTTVGTVFLGPYVANLAREAAGANGLASFFGIPVAPDSFMPYCISFSVFMQVLFLPVLGAIADYTHLRKRMLQIFAIIGALATTAMFFVDGDLWWLGGVLFVVANLTFGAAMVFYNAYLPDLATEDRRDSVSSFAWAMGYLGGALLLTGNLALYLLRDNLGLSTSMAVRLNLASAGLWWLGWALITFVTLRPRHAARQLPPGENYLTIGFKQLWQTLREANHYPHTIRFIIAYLLYNDGIQTVIAVAAVFAAAPIIQGGLGLETGTLTQIILMIQFVAFVGALAFGWVAGKIGARNALIGSLVIWAGVVIYAYGFLQTEGQFWILGATIAVVMGGSQAISRSIFSQMIPPGKEAEFFAVYEVSERGTSWIGPLLFGLANQIFNNLRPAILSLIFFFVVGLVLLLFVVDIPRAIRESKSQPTGEPLPAAPTGGA